MGKYPNTGQEVQRPESKVPAVDEFIDWMESLKKEVRTVLRKTNKTMKK